MFPCSLGLELFIVLISVCSAASVVKFFIAQEITKIVSIG